MLWFLVGIIVLLFLLGLIKKFYDENIYFFDQGPVPRMPRPGEWDHENFCPLCWSKWGKPTSPCDWALCYECWRKQAKKKCPTCQKPRLIHFSGLRRDGSIVSGQWGSDSCEIASYNAGERPAPTEPAVPKPLAFLEPEPLEPLLPPHKSENSN